MRLSFSLLCAASVTYAQYVVESLSFGQETRISPNKYGIPGWHVSGEGHVPQMLSDKIILTPPYPGNRRGALWADNPISQAEWSVDFEFRATGQEHGGGNLQVWYTKEGQGQIGPSSVYTVGAFDGLVIVVDMHGGKGGSVRGFLNDGSIDYKNHHHLEELAFGHCDYSYRNLGRPSRIHLLQDSNGFEVIVDDNRCFRSDQVKLPSENYFGVTAASSETPDSFEVFKFIVKTTTSVTREEPKRQKFIPTDNQNEASKQAAANTIADADAGSFKSQLEQFTDLHNRLQMMSHSIDNLYRELSKYQNLAGGRHHETQSMLATREQMSSLDGRLQGIENTLSRLGNEFRSKDYTHHFNDIHDSLKARHDSLLEILPGTMGHAIVSHAPRTSFMIILVIGSQILLAAAYLVYKRRRAGAPKKYL